MTTRQKITQQIMAGVMLLSGAVALWFGTQNAQLQNRNAQLQKWLDGAAAQARTCNVQLAQARAAIEQQSGPLGLSPEQTSALVQLLIRAAL